MSKHNYSQYSKKNNNHQVEETLDPVIEVVEVTPAVEEISAVPEVIVPVVEPAPEPKTVEGTVVGCAKLNVRVKPNMYAAVVSVIDVNDKVVIDPDESVKDWFKVRTAKGIVGYCMRKFVNANL